MSIIFKPVVVSKSDIPVRLTDIWSMDNSGKTVIFSYSTYDLKRYDLDFIGTLIWYLCDGSHSIEDIAKTIQRLGKDSSSAKQEFIDKYIKIIQNFQDCGLIYIGNSYEL